ncbi:MAG: GNAT family N-acetyltransferase [Rhodospirillaceae bacterium]|jgi:ribosomal-protein-alanine N-acetyltransferase|nr:GNAT family N-acetyltransferase [Rhodospirillaceae bacterium]MBT3494300.1 GNAT family N-acetyltransferase [Rhodospirillaceae bacterium]MBT3778620.1 GNAT family N-acetyltransferase [Rhodospirillaceae bacterium]MBT3979159.1 GNAT family N-acetyltransferase [Rhodospirillaceae bacterium]MBT4171053.1 GNAT family N-acetyltransferase [Rhodospirillaceae bacterium]
MSLEISPAGAGSCALLARLHGLCFSEAWTQDAFASLLAMPGAFAFLASTEESAQQMPAGFALARAGGGECEIIALGVVPARRNTGTGTALLGAIVAQARLLCVEDLLLEVAADNAAAIALYRAAAFVPVGRRKSYYRGEHGAGREDGVDAIIMRRTLLP